MSIKIVHYSDLLCVWAYVGESRLLEVRERFPEVEIEDRFCSVFGDTATKIEAGWRNRGGYEGFAEHVREVAARFELDAHSALWRTTRPASSHAAHLWVKACQLVEERSEVEAGSSVRFTSALRRAFFQDGVDIARAEALADTARALGLPLTAIEAEIGTGTAHARLARDAQGKEQWGVRGSPTLLLNEGRQHLYGNVGYRVIEANIQELLREPQAGQASWC